MNLEQPIVKMIKSTVSKEFDNTCDENISEKIENGIYMKEELIITDVNNQLDNEGVRSSNDSLVTQNTKNNITQDNEKDKSQVTKENGDDDDDDDIIIVAEEKPSGTKNNSRINQSSGSAVKQTVIVPEILQQMATLKMELKKGNKVPKSTIFVKRCRLCKKVQKQSRSRTMIKCQECESWCFLFQCLMCFKRYTTVNEVYGHIDKKHPSIVLRDVGPQEVQEQPAKGIKVKSNKCLDTNEKFQFNINGYTPVQKVENQPSEVLEEVAQNNNASVLQEDEEIQFTATPNTSKNSSNTVLQEDIPLQWESPSSRPLMRCSDCDYSTPNKRHFREHVTRRHTVIDLNNLPACSICGKRFRQPADVKSHERYCGKEPHLKCKYCDYRTKYKNTLKTHLQSHVAKAEISKQTSIAGGSDNKSNDNDIVFEPNNAVKYIGPAGDADIDEKIFTENQIKKTIQAYCERCNRRTKAIKSKTKCQKCEGPLVYRCKCCSHSEPHYGEQRQHVERTHYSRLPKPCPKCGKLVVEMRSHMRFCGLELRYRCEYCTFRTKHHRSYYVHLMNKHHDNRKGFFNCEKCGKNFAMHTYLRRHQRYYCDTEARFGCAHCSLKTRSKANLVRHIRLLHMECINDVKFSCDNCGIEYRNVYMYDKHMEHCGKIG